MNRYLPPELPIERVAASIGLISATHMPQRWPSLPPAIFDVMSGIDLLLHAGDVGELWVLDQLSGIAPVIAVHGNDDSEAATGQLPFQQLVAIAGKRILLWHSHYPDREKELASRRDDVLRSKLTRSIERGQQAGANIIVFGHWHIPLTYHHEGLLLVNPGAIASSNEFTRQLRQTVALLFIRDDGHPFVVHVDLATPADTYHPGINWDAGFVANSVEYSTSILGPELKATVDLLLHQLYPLAPELLRAAFLRLSHRCWSGQQKHISRTDLLAEIHHNTNVPLQVKVKAEALLTQPDPQA